MHPSFADTRQHAYNCAQTECLITPELASRALNCTPDAAREALKDAADAGYLRPLLLPGLGNKIIYQPTAKAAQCRGPNAPKFLRAGLAQDARWRGLLRGFVRFAARPELSFLPVEELAALCLRYGIQERGHARALAGLDGAHTHIFAPILRVEKLIAAIETASFRWLPLLDSGVATLHFSAQAGPVAAGVNAALAALAPRAGDVNLRAELEALDAEIQADKSGMAALKLSARRSRLQIEIEAAGTAGGADYGWLGGVVEMQV